MRIFKIGDKVKVVRHKNNCYYSEIGETGVVTNVGYFDDVYPIQIRLEKKNSKGLYEEKFAEEDLELITTNTNNMNTLDKFALLFKSEPEKSFRKAGITNSDDMLTDDGQKIFLSWLMKKNGDAFKTEVVDPLLADTK